jgi:hypothetical protein
MPDIVKIIISSIVLKISYLIFALIINQHERLPQYVALNFQGYISVTSNADTGWYEKISKNGYPEIHNVDDIGYSCKEKYKQSEWAFFPFYPWLLVSLNKITSLDFDVCGFILSIIFSLLVFIGFYWFLLSVAYSSEKAFYFTMILMLFPFHYYFSMQYTEAIFFTLMIFCFLAVNKNKLYFLPFLVIPLTLVRPNGILILLPLFIFYLEKQGAILRYKVNWKTILNRKIFYPMLFFLAGPVAFILWGFYQKQMTGEFFAFSIAQRGWYRHLMIPILAFFRTGGFATQFNSYYTILIILIAILWWKKLPLYMNILVWVSIIAPLCSGSVTSMPRFISVIFPFSIIFSGWFITTKFKYPLLIILFSLQIFVFYFWLTGNPFSF